MLDLKRLYKGAWVTATPGSGAGADLVCWNCAAIASKGQACEVWVWEVKSEGQSQSTALKSLNAGIVWASDHILRGRQGGQPIPVKPGQKFPTPSSGVNRMNPRQVVTVYSDPKSQVDNGVEYYRTDDFEKRLPANHKLNHNSEEANIAIDDSREETKRHMIKAADTVGVKDDPVSGWLIAGGIGLGVAFGGWAIAGLLPGGAAAAGGGAAVGAGAGVQGQYGLAG